MRIYYLFEIEADEKHIYNIGEWENEENLTHDSKNAQEMIIVAYGEVTGGEYIELYKKVPID